MSGSEASYADIVTVTCDDGYRLNNTERNFSKVMTCTETGSWAGDSATCERMTHVYIAVECKYLSLYPVHAVKP